MSTFKNIYAKGIALSDSLFQVNTGASADTRDIGLFGSYVASGTKYTGLFRDAAGTTSAAGDYVFFKDLTTIPNLSTGVVSGTAVTVANLVAAAVKHTVGSVSAPTMTFSTALTTGLYYETNTVSCAVGGSKVAGITTTGMQVIAGTGAAPSFSFITDATSGVFYSGGAKKGVSITSDGVDRLKVENDKITVASSVTLSVASTTTSTSSASGALTIAGGVGVAENLYVGGNAVITGDLTISGTTTQVDSTIVNIHDNVLLVNSGPTGVADGGYAIARYSSDVVTDVAFETGTAQGGAAATIILKAASIGAVDGYYKGFYVKITASGTGGPPLNEVRQISAYVTATQTATVSVAWSSGTPANDTTYALYAKSNYGIIYSTADKAIEFLAFPDSTLSNFGVAQVGLADIKANAATLASILKVPYGTAGAPTYTFTPDATLGVYGATNTIGFAVGGASIATMIADGMLMKVGSAAAPSYSFTGDANTGIYHSAADSVSIATNGAVKFTIADTAATMDAAILTTIFNSLTDSTSTTSGSVQLLGGLGVDKTAYIRDLVVTGTMTLPYRNITNIAFAASPYTVLATDSIITVDTSGGNVVINLPSITTIGAVGRLLTFVKVTGDTNTVTLTPSSGDSVIDGTANSTLVFNTAWQYSSLVSVTPASGTKTWINN